VNVLTAGISNQAEFKSFEGLLNSVSG